jgi:F-type H+-transporting ATPase subunit a
VAAPNAGAHGGGMPDPIHQFEIHTLIPIKIFGYDVSFTNASLFMLIAVLLIASFFTVTMRARSLVPTRLQSISEITHEFVGGMLVTKARSTSLTYSRSSSSFSYATSWA